jgi:hypothetical protein
MTVLESVDSRNSLISEAADVAPASLPASWRTHRVQLWIIIDITVPRTTMGTFDITVPMYGSRTDEAYAAAILAGSALITPSCQSLSPVSPFPLLRLSWQCEYKYIQQCVSSRQSPPNSGDQRETPCTSAIFTLFSLQPVTRHLPSGLPPDSLRMPELQGDITLMPLLSPAGREWCEFSATNTPVSDMCL